MIPDTVITTKVLIVKYATKFLGKIKPIAKYNKKNFIVKCVHPGIKTGQYSFK